MKYFFQGSQAYVLALEKANLVTSNERQMIYDGLTKVSVTISFKLH